MFAMPTPIEIYEEMSALSGRMVEAARASDWDLLIDLERSVAALRTRLGTEEEEVSLSAQDTERRRAMIQSILANDAEIRLHTEPWMERLRRYLSVPVRRRQVEKAYSDPVGDSPR